MFLSGLLNDPLPLLTWLTKQKHDDIFRHRLALAALCLPEAQAKLHGASSSIVDRISTELFSFWLQHEQTETGAVVAHVGRSLPALGLLNGRMKGTPLIEWCCQQLRDLQGEERYGIIEALGQMREGLASHDVALRALKSMLQDADSLTRSAATRAWQLLISAGQRPHSLPILTHLALFDTNWFVRAGAVEALRQLRTAAIHHPQVVGLLTEAAHATDLQVRHHTVNLLRKLNTTVELPSELVAILVDLQHDGDEFIRASASSVLVEVQNGMAPHPTYGRQESLDVGAPLSREEVTELVQALANPDAQVRTVTAARLGRAGDSITRYPEVLSVLLQTVAHEKDSGVRAEMIGALGRLGVATADHPHGLRQLVYFLRQDKDSGARVRALQALGQIGKEALRLPAVLPALFDSLHDRDEHVRFAAAEALQQLMAQGVRIFLRRFVKKIQEKRVEQLAAL